MPNDFPHLWSIVNNEVKLKEQNGSRLRDSKNELVVTEGGVLEGRGRETAIEGYYV